MREHLAVLNFLDGIEVWDDQSILPGSDWEREIDKVIHRAVLAIFLVSPHSLASDYCQNTEVPLLLERQTAGQLKILPVLLRHCKWQRFEWLRNLQMFPGGDKALLNDFPSDQIDRYLDKLVETVTQMLAKIEPDDRPDPPSTTPVGAVLSLVRIGEIRKTVLVARDRFGRRKPNGRAYEVADIEHLRWPSLVFVHFIGHGKSFAGEQRTTSGTEIWQALFERVEEPSEPLVFLSACYTGGLWNERAYRYFTDHSGSLQAGSLGGFGEQFQELPKDQRLYQEEDSLELTGLKRRDSFGLMRFDSWSKGVTNCDMVGRGLLRPKWRAQNHRGPINSGEQILPRLKELLLHQELRSVHFGGAGLSPRGVGYLAFSSEEYAGAKLSRMLHGEPIYTSGDRRWSSHEPIKLGDILPSIVTRSAQAGKAIFQGLLADQLFKNQILWEPLGPDPVANYARLTGIHDLNDVLDASGFPVLYTSGDRRRFSHEPIKLGDILPGIVTRAVRAGKAIFQDPLADQLFKNQILGSPWAPFQVPGHEPIKLDDILPSIVTRTVQAGNAIFQDPLADQLFKNQVLGEPLGLDPIANYARLTGIHNSESKPPALPGDSQSLTFPGLR